MRTVKELMKSFHRNWMAPWLRLRSLKQYRQIARFRRERKEWKNQGGEITRKYQILSDYDETAGSASGHYFHQDLLVARLIFEQRPKRHVDVGSRIDGFVAHVASFRTIEVLDRRPLPPTPHSNIKFVQADIMGPHEIGVSDSVSCLHTIEHIGLGRYGDKVDVDGHRLAINNLIGLLGSGGRLYLSFPIGKSDEVHFNAHRVFHPKSILMEARVLENLHLERFDFVDDEGSLNLDCSVDDAIGRVSYGCGIYTFVKKAS